MKHVKWVLLLGLVVLALSACSRGGRSPAGISQGIDSWLDTKAVSAPKVNLTGKWDAGSAFAGGWGEGNFVQDNARVTGTLGMYGFKGVVSGNEVYFALVSNGTVYYTGQMTGKSDGTFSGKTVRDILVDAEAAKTAEGYPISLTKMQ